MVRVNRYDDDEDDQYGGYGVPGQGKGRVLTPQWKADISKGERASYERRFGRSTSRKRSNKMKGGYGVPGQGKNYPADWRHNISVGEKESYERRFGRSTPKKNSKSKSKSKAKSRSKKQKGGYGVPGQGKNYPADWRQHISQGEEASYRKRYGRAPARSRSKYALNGGYGIPGQGKGRVEDPQWRRDVSMGEEASYKKRYGHAPARSRSKY